MRAVFRLMRLCLTFVAALAALPLSPAAVRAENAIAVQAATKAAARQVQALVDRGMTTLNGGGENPGWYAMQDIDLANALAIATPDLPLTITYLPNLAASRAYLVQQDWENVVVFASAVLRAFDDPQNATQPMRIEAAARLAHAMMRQGRAADAAAILAPVTDAIKALPRASETDLARFWYAAALMQDVVPGWPEAAAKAYLLLDSKEIRSNDKAAFLDDYLFWSRETDGDSDLILEIAEASAIASVAPGVHKLDRAVHMGRVADVLSEHGRFEEAMAMAEAELAHLGEGYAGQGPRNALGMRLIRLWFQNGEIDRGIAFCDTLLAETTALPSPNWVDQNLLHVLRGAAFNHLGRTAEAQEDYRRAYAAARQYERATSHQAQVLAASIDPNDPGYAGFEYAGELSDASGIRTDGPADTVLLRFLAGEYALTERVFANDTLTPDDANVDEIDRNKILHLALSGQAADAKQQIEDLLMYFDSMPDPARYDAARDELLLFATLSSFWWQGDGVQDEPAFFADLARLAGSLPPDRASFIRAMRITALNNDGRIPEAQEALQDWRAAHDPARTTFTPWDVAAAMVAVEMAYSLFDAELAHEITEMAALWMENLPPMGLARDYFALVRLLNAPMDLETDRGLLQLGAIVQRLSAQVPQGHILRASSRFGLANALAARGQFPQARDMMAAAASELRLNPNYRPDVMAFLQSLQAQILSQMGKRDLAMNMARAAYDGLTPHARGDYRVNIVTVLTWEMVANGRYAQAAALAEAELSDPTFTAQLLPDLQVACLRTRAWLQETVGETSRARDLLNQADTLAAASTKVTMGQRIALMWDRGIYASNAGHFEPALRSIAAANDTYFSERAKVAAASTSGHAVALGQDLERVLFEASVAWALYQERTASLAQTRPESGP